MRDAGGRCRPAFTYGPNPLSTYSPDKYKGSIPFYMGLQVGRPAQFSRRRPRPNRRRGRPRGGSKGGARRPGGPGRRQRPKVSSTTAQPSGTETQPSSMAATTLSSETGTGGSAGQGEVNEVLEFLSEGLVASEMKNFASEVSAALAREPSKDNQADDEDD